MAKQGKLVNLLSIAIISTIIIVPPAFSQNLNLSNKIAFDFDDLNKVKDLIPSKTPEVEKTVVPAPSPAEQNKEQTDEQNQKTPDVPPVTKIEKPKLIYDKTFKPVLAYGRLIRETIKMFSNGNFEFRDAVGVFLPYKDEIGQDVTFGWYDGNNHEMLALLKDGKGNVLMKTPFFGRNSESSPPFLLLSPLSDGTNSDMEAKGFKNKIKLPEGSYITEFYLDNKVFYKISFSVRKMVKGTPYNPNDVFAMEGPWSEFGYISYENADPNNQLSWNVYLRNEKPDPAARDQSLNIKINLKNSANKVLAKVAYPDYDIGLREWESCGFLFTRPDDTMFFARDLLKVNGKYQIEMTINSKKSIYPFEVKNKKIQFQGRQIREKTDPLHYIEGGLDMFWIQKKGGTYK